MTRYIIITVLAVLHFTAVPVPVYDGSPLYSHLFFHFFHANIFHLSGNAMCVALLRNVRWVEAYVIATLGSLWIDVPTIGFSGVIFSAIGIWYGYSAEYQKALRSLAYAVVTGMLPGVSMSYHIISLLSGFAYGWTIESIRIYRRIRPR